jgi:rfaE bifunctional protein kinase chain/domain
MDGAARAWIGEVVAEVERLRRPGGRVAFVSGNFNIVHPGHLRLLNFAAACGDLLVVGVYADDVAGAHLPQALRLEGVSAIGVVDYAFLLPERPDSMIRCLRPQVVVKGKEHEAGFNAEQAAVDSYGGSLLFGSGETGFSSLDLLRREFDAAAQLAIAKPLDYPQRHGFSVPELIGTVQGFGALRVAVVGDLIVDEYVSCDALGMSQEDPTLVVSPIAHDRFLGGAGIVAAHAAGLGAQVTYFSVAGDDADAAYAIGMLRKYRVEASLLADASRPTTLKQRYRVGNRTLLRVSHLRQHDIGGDLADELHRRILPALDGLDLLIFSDFNYGALPQALVDRVGAACRARGIMMVADSQASSQMGDVSRFTGMRLLTPTEREARLAMRDTRSGLVVLADALLRKADARHVVMTLGAEGMLVHAPREGHGFATDRLPAFNNAPKDVSGAGDSLLTCTAMALARGDDIWRSAYLGAVAAACQVGRVGNMPLAGAQLVAESRR